MGVMDYERNRQRQKKIEVKALIAIMRYGRTHARKAHAEKKLCEIAFPEDHIKQAEQETLVYECQDCADLYGIDAGMPNCKCEKCEKISEFIKNGR
jgi:hypothetical protein|tara:strand:- start:325 stop:612 length:288 start_codon:yes stop_codon:yes gene_type:complete